MFKSTKNKFAKALKIYSMINILGGIILSIWLFDNTPIDESVFYALGFFFLSLVASAAIFGFGEVIELLESIKNNTSNGAGIGAKGRVENNELPEL